MISNPKLHAVNLSCVRQRHVLFASVSFSLNAGEVLLVEGANGSGKTSLLRLLTGLAAPAAGQIFWQDKPIQDLQSAYWEHLHYMGHTNGVKLGLSVLENLQLSCHLSSSAMPTLETVLSDLQLSAHKNTPLRFLSAGQKRRAGLAKLFLFPKPLWILDEPFTALDTNTQAYFISRLEEHAERGGAAIISSHHSIICKVKMQTLRLA